MFEYLRHVGHPVRTIFVDPRAAVKTLWYKGGLISNVTGFTPHFVIREVKQRYEWINSEDIKGRLEELYRQQAKAKEAEQNIMKNHDFTNILLYFRNMKELRAQETLVRDHCLSEMEAARARVDSQMESVRMMRQQLEECETLHERACLALNKEFAVQESAAVELTALKRRDETDTHRLECIVDSYMAVEEYRQYKNHEVEVMWSPARSASIGAFREAFKISEKDEQERKATATVPVPLVLAEPEECSLHIQNLAKKLRLYKEQKDRYDNRLRKCATRLYRTGVKLRRRANEMEEKAKRATSRAEVAEDKLTSADVELRDAARKIGKEREVSRAAAAYAWDDAWHNRIQIEEFNDRVLRCRPALAAAMCVDGNPQLNQLATVISGVFNAFTEEEEACIMNRYAMLCYAVSVVWSGVLCLLCLIVCLYNHVCLCVCLGSI